MKKYFSLLTISAIGFFAYSCTNEKVENKSANVFLPKAYKIISLSPHSLGETLKLPGVLQPFEFVQIYPKVSGYLKNIYVDRGSEVKAGQVLMQLEAPEIEEHTAAAKLKYLEARANIQLSKDKYHRLLKTSKTPGTVSAYDLQAAYSKMMADSAIVQGELADYDAQMDIDSYLTVRAPFDGIITQRNVHPGALVGPGEEGNAMPMLILQQQKKLRLVVNIPEQYSSQVNDGDKVYYTINSIPGVNFVGRISRSSGSLSEKYRAETVEIDVQNPDEAIKCGMYAEIQIPVAGDHNAFSIPQSAIVTTTEGKYVVALDNNIANYVNVSEGNEDGDSTEVFGDLKMGERIIANANYNIRQGQRIM